MTRDEVADLVLGARTLDECAAAEQALRRWIERHPDDVAMQEIGERLAMMQEARAKGILEAGEPLEITGTARTVRQQKGSYVTTDGPFADTKEVFGGYYVFDVDNLDEALELAARIPSARLGGKVEVRPIVERPS